jgi:hypothetical protein
LSIKGIARFAAYRVRKKFVKFLAVIRGHQTSKNIEKAVQRLDIKI